MAVKELSDKGPDGTRLGQSADDLVGFHGADPIAQLEATTAPAATAATSTTPFGYSQTQADAIVTWIRAVDAHLKSKGIIASS
jgi:hypothetical protein